jgi:hypothetical protein
VGLRFEGGRISQAAHWRPYYYLTTDERVGDIMHTTAHVDQAIEKFDPMRIASPQIPASRSSQCDFASVPTGLRSPATG